MPVYSTLVPTQNHHLTRWSTSPGLILKLWIAILFFCPAVMAEEEEALSPNHMYVVTFLLGEGSTETALDDMSDFFTDTYPMDTMLLPDDFMNTEKKTITMIGPSLGEIVGFVEGACDFNKVEIKNMKAGKLTKEFAETVIKKIKAKVTDEDEEPKKEKEKAPGKGVEAGKGKPKQDTEKPIP